MLLKSSRIVWIVLIVLAMGRAALWHHPRHQGCYSVFEIAGSHWLSGSDLYDHRTSYGVFHYSPFVGALLAPLGLVPSGIGNALVRLVNLLVFLPALAWWMRTALPERWTSRERACFLLVLALLCNNSLMELQFNVLLTGMLLGTMAAVAQQRWWLAALLCSVAVHLKAYPLALALLLTTVYPRQFAPRWLVAMILIGLAPFALQGPEYVFRQYVEWCRFGLNRDCDPALFQNARCFYVTWIGPMSRNVYFALEVTIGASMALVCLSQRRRGMAPPALHTLIFTLACVWMTAFGPSTEAATYIVIAPVLAAALVPVWSEPQPWPFRALVTSANGIVILSQLELIFPLNRPTQHLAALPVAGLLLLLGMALRSRGHLPYSFPRWRHHPA